MNSRTAASGPRGRVGARVPGSLIGKLRKRGILAGLAAFVGGGWFVYEIVHFILVDHYGLSEHLEDIVIVTTLGVTLCNLCWRWFRHEGNPRRIRWELFLIPAFALTATAIDVHFLLRVNAAVRHSSFLRPRFDNPGWKYSIAVLPFINLSAEPGQDYFCDGLTEEMISRFSQIAELKVAARTSVFALKGKGQDIREIGRVLGVDKVLEGSVRKDGLRLRITAQLIDVDDGFHLWSESYDRELDKVLVIQDEIARAVAKELEMTLLEAGGPLSQTKDIEAYNEYLLGQHYYRVLSQENLEKAIGHYERAVAIDPLYAQAWAALGAALAFQAGVGFAPTEPGYAKALRAVEKALELDSDLAYGHVVKGWIQMTFLWDWAGADASYAKALRLEPARGYFGAAQLALTLGRLEQAVTLARRAVDLDSLNAQALLNLALAVFYAGRPDEARDVFLKAFEISPESDDLCALLAQVYLVQSLPELALATVRKERDPYFRLPGEAMAYHALGREADSKEALGQFIDGYREGGAYQIAQIHAYRGEIDRAFDWLEIAFGQHDGGLYLTKVDPLLDVLRPDPRFATFLGKLGLPVDKP